MNEDEADINMAPKNSKSSPTIIRIDIIHTSMSDSYTSSIS